ncbi:MAG: DUF2505 domain-containing protein [Myxococcota bacterium]
MKKLHVENHLPTSAKEAWEVFESDEYKERLREQTNIKQEILETRTEGNIEIRRIRTEPDRELPGMVASAIGTKKLSYVQENRFDRASGRMEWSVELDGIGDRVTVKGVTTCVPDGDGCKRVVDGEITVKVPLVGGQIEKAVVAEFEKSMQRSNEVALDLIRQRQA